VSGDVDYGGAGGAGMRAACAARRSRPSCSNRKVTWYLIAAPEIASRRFERQARVAAVGTVGDSQDALITAYAERNGLSGRDLVRSACRRTTMTTILGLKSAIKRRRSTAMKR
jgi:hypothetical protein